MLNKLSIITKEEQNILNGSKDIDRNFYMISADNVVSCSKFLPSGTPIAMRPHTRFVHFPAHSHDFIEIVYMCSGHTTHIIDGKTLLLGEGDFLIMKSGTMQEILPAGKNDIAVNFIVRSDFFEETINTFSISLPSFSEYLHFSVPELLPVHNLAENLIWLLLGDAPRSIKQCRLTLGLLLTTLIKSRNTSGEAVEHVLAYIDENYKDGSLSYISETLHYDFSWLSREIKMRTGKTYTDLVQEKRLSEACFLLRNTDMNVSDIAVRVGYNNISYFHRLFARYFGMSPHKYRMLP
ncbi:MAG: helix-turn-helix domain-containing protein [Clostridia bacterium]|nr:helix-turn-helix domain-containing protein [Clostridia bacterium]